MNGSRWRASFVADHRTLVKEVIWHGPTNDPLLMHLPERAYSLSIAVHWMLRVVDPAVAIAQRGYARGASAEVHLELQYEPTSLPARRMIVTVSQGTAMVQPGGRGDVRCDLRGLAALYSGFMTPSQLVRAGRVCGSGDDLQALATVFAGDPPAMVDIF